jgi:hypothetical protein
LEVPIDTMKVEAYLAGLRNSGVWPVALRLQVMVEPKPGQGLEGILAEAELPIDWTPAPAEAKTARP